MTWRGLAVTVGFALLIPVLMWTASYPLLTATLLALVAGIAVMMRLGARIV